MMGERRWLRALVVLGPEPQSRVCQHGSGSVPRAWWFLFTDVPTVPARGREGHSRRKMSRYSQLQTTVTCEAVGSWAKPDLQPSKDPVVTLSPLSWAQLPTDGMDPLAPAHPRKAEAAVCIIFGREPDLEESIRRKQEEEEACHRTQRPLAARGKFGFWGYIPRRPALPPSPPTSRGVGQSPWRA